MIWRIRIGRWRFTWTMARTQHVIGVNSILDNGAHILMWDFDDVKLPTVRETLEYVQRVYELPPIYILETKRKSNYIAYCFKRVPWRKAVEIICSTPNVDYGFIKYGVYRQHFTLRVTPKGKRKPVLIHIIPSGVKEDAYITHLRNWVRYETLEDGQEVKVKELRLK
uniref:Uncharacterized protein n=1 Tax=viral metagenome TaxID=1070528 RepID=A0A6H2A2X0_9ZZZZ